MDACIQQNYINIPVEAQAELDLISEQFADVINLFDPISLAEMDTVSLMNRVDTKFLLNISSLHELLKTAAEHYRIVEILDQRLSPYSSIYFDTDDVEMYTKHHNGKLNRFKIRTRTYINSGLVFLEIKHKSNKGRTAKRRIKIKQNEFRTMKFGPSELSFIGANLPYPAEILIPQLQNYFQRITLVDKAKTERVTLDLGISFRKTADGKTVVLDDLAIIEMKQDGACKSFFRHYLNDLGVLPGSMSKYCLGMVLLNPTIKSNRFKRKIRKINKITKKNHATI